MPCKAAGVEKRGILAYRGRQRRTPLARALELAREIMAYVGDGPPVHRLTYAGSLRRAEVTVGDIDIVCTSDEAGAVIDRFVTWDRARAVLAEGPTKASIWLAGGLQIDLRVLPAHLYGNLLQRRLRDDVIKDEPTRRRQHSTIGNVRDGISSRRGKLTRSDQDAGPARLAPAGRPPVRARSRPGRRFLFLAHEPERRLEIDWQEQEGERFTVRLSFEANDRRGLYADVAAAVSATGTDIRSMELHTLDGRVTGSALVEVENLAHLEKIMKAARRVKGVFEVARRERITGDE